MSERLDGLYALVLGDSGAADAVERGLAQLGAEVRRDAADAEGVVKLVVIPVTDPGGLAPAALADMDDDAWIARCEAPLKAMRVALQTAHRVLAEHGGAVILLVPTIAMVGQAGFAPFSAVGEGARSLAKAAARGWGKARITVNCIALTSEQLCPGADGAPGETKVPRALGHLPVLETEVAEFIAGIVRGPAIMTGITIPLDGGNIMTV
jgi:3-oxoacyl-[acyl-carrier protein] reductase